MGKGSLNAKFFEMTLISWAFSQVLVDVLCGEKLVCKTNQLGQFLGSCQPALSLLTVHSALECQAEKS